jgi:non-homologous end joining protein Ku
VHELVRAKIEQRAPEVEIETPKGELPKVVNIMDALKKSMQARGQAKVRDAVRRRMGKEPASEKRARASKSAKPTSGARRSVH